MGFVSMAAYSHQYNSYAAKVMYRPTPQWLIQYQAIKIQNAEFIDTAINKALL